MVGRRFLGGLDLLVYSVNRTFQKESFPCEGLMSAQNPYWCGHESSSKGWSLGEFSPYLGIKKASKTGISVSSSHSQLILVSCQSAGLHVFVPVCGVWRPKDVGSWKLILGWNYIIVFFVRDLNFGCEKDKIWLVDMYIFTYIYTYIIYMIYIYIYDIYIYIYDIYIYDIYIWYIYIWYIYIWYIYIYDIYIYMIYVQ